MKLQFDTHGNEKQKDCARAWNDPAISDIVYGGSKGGAKSFTGCSLIFGDGFTYPGTHYFIARKKLNDLRKYTLPSIYEVFEIWGLNKNYYSFNAQDNFFTLYNESKVFLLEAAWMPSDPLYTRFGSMQMTRGWIEEAGEFELDAKNNLMASVGRWKNDKYNLPRKLLQTCNPAKNYLYKDYYRKFKEGNLESWKKFIQAFPQDNKKLQAGYLENLHRTLTTNQKERLLYGNWEYDDDPSALMDYNNIRALWTNHHIKNQDGSTKSHDGKLYNQRYMTIDVARLGDDSTRIWLWHGLHAFRCVKLTKKRTNEVADQAKILQRENNIPMANTIIDEDGVGGGVVDLMPGCVGFMNGSKPFRGENYDNLKSQCYFKLADLVNSNDILVTCSAEDQELLTEELEQVKEKDVDSEGKKGVIPKAQVKELLGRSPDISDSLMLRMYPICKSNPNDKFNYSFGSL